MAINHPIDIHHRNHINYVVFQQKLRLLALAQQPINHSLADIGALALPRVLPGHEKDSLPVILLPIGGLRDDQPFDDPFAESLSDGDSGDPVLVLCALVDDVLIKFFGGVGVGVGNVDFVILEQSRKFKAQLVVKPP